MTGTLETRSQSEAHAAVKSLLASVVHEHREGCT